LNTYASDAIKEQSNTAFLKDLWQFPAERKAGRDPYLPESYSLCQF